MKKRKRLASWLLVLILVLNVFSPLNTVWAEGLDSLGESLDSVIEISGSDDAATGSQATKPDSTETEKDETGIPDEHGSTDGINTGEPAIATDSSALNPSVVSLPAVSPLGLADGTDKTGDLMDLDITVTQNGSTIGDDGSLTSTDPVNIKISFRVPVEGDDFDDVTPAPTLVHKGDTATFEVSDAFTLVDYTENTPIPLKKSGNVFGHVTFTSEDGTMYAVVTFDGEDYFYDGTDNTVTCDFSAKLQYDASGANGNEGDHIISLLDKTYTVTVPTVKTDYSVEKSGVVDLKTQTIQWTVMVRATKAGVNTSLDGYKFYDDLTDVGEYVTDTFKVGPDSKTPVPIGKAISYEFPENSTSPQTVTFSTKISDASYYAASEQKIKNTAKLLDSSDDTMAEGSKEVSWTPKWIEKDGTSSDAGSTGIYDPTNRTITWTITANHNGAKLDGVVIKDILPAGLTFQSAEWQTWNGTDWNAATSLSDPGINGEYNIGNINSKILLTIVTNVTNTDLTTVISDYTNSASIKWDGLTGSGYGSNSKTVGVGYNAISKQYTNVDPSTGRISWKVTVDPRGQSITDPKVYDLLVYGSSGFDSSKVTGIPSDISDKLTPQYNQKYIANTFSGSGLTLTPHPIMQDGVQVADLLEITGFSTSASTFTFDSKVVNPDIFASNSETTLYNTASLFSANAKLNEATAHPSYDSKILAKEMLKRESMDDPVAGKNNSTTDASKGFDYKNKAVIFRLSVNANGMDFTQMKDANGNALGMATITDTLPPGWVFDQIDENDYLIFNGTKGSNGSVTASTQADALVTVPSPSSFIGENSVSFTFNLLDKPYVILVKARPTSDTAAGYFDANETTSVRNNLSLKTDHSKEVARYQDVSIVSKILEKSLEIKAAGVAKWTVNYKPYDLSQLGTVLKDTLPQGIDLRTDSNGALILTDENITVHEMTLNADGSYTLGDKVTLTQGENIFYDNAEKILSFNIPDNTKAYQFCYITDITGEPGQISNQVSLYGNSGKQEGTSKPYIITDVDGNASSQRNGSITITKTDASGNLLPGVEFTLFAKNGQTVIKKGITDSKGILKFKVIPDGDYILQETAPLSGYNPDGRVHYLSVTTAGGIVTSSIDGGGNTITIKNFQEGTTGDLTISKTLGGDGGDKTIKFDFTVTFDSNGTYSYRGTGVGVLDGTIKSGDTISLADGESITIIGLPKDIAYEVKEADYTDIGYTTASTGASGNIEVNQEQTASFTNTKHKPGDLIIKKEVVGNPKEDTKFKFTINLTKPNSKEDTDSYSYTIKGGNEADKSDTIKSGDNFFLSKNQWIEITGLPDGTKYTVTEDDYSESGYATSSENASNTIATKIAQIVSFTNTKWLPGSLTIKKTVAGNADENIAFDFTVALTKPDGTPDNGLYDYSGTGGTGKISNGGHISLAHGQSITITGLPKDTAYEVTENNDPQSGYSMSPDHNSGIIVTDDEQTASFTNTKWLPGSLTISKTVTGSGGDTKKKFDFTVTFTAAGSYSYTGNGVDSGTIKSGDKISLADGESITITGLPDGTKYQVTETDYTTQRYSTTKTGDTGTIDTLTTSAAAFTNTYHKRSSGGGSSSGGGNSGPKPTQPTTTTPTEPSTPTQKPREEMTPQEVYDVYGEVPRGYMVGPDNGIHTPQEIYEIWGQVPLGYMVGIDGQLVPLGLPKTGDGKSANMAVYILFGFSVLLGIFASATILQKDEETDN